MTNEQVRSRRQSVLFATLDSSEPMGQQAYEEAILTAMRLRSAESGLEVLRVTVAPLTSPAHGVRRAPMGLVGRSSPRLQWLIGATTYRSLSLVHRTDLRLPPAPREVVTVHDLAPLRFTDEGALPAHVGRQLRRASHVICPSHFAASELRNLLGVEGAVVIPNGVGDDTRGALPLTEADREHLGLRLPYVIHSGGATARKNLGALAAAWRQLVAELDEDLALVLCGPHDDRRDRLFAGLPRVHLLGKVRRELLLRLVRSATVAIVPSTYEGFGLPALEAMACGTPVIASAAAALPEVCGQAAHLVDPTARGLANGIRRVFQDAQLSTTLRSLGLARATQFTWERAARQHLDVYRAILDAGSAGSHVGRF